MEGRSHRDLPKVSIIVPVRNCGSTIDELLTSLMEVDYPKDKMEIIVVDGGSSDDTVKRALKYPVKLLFEPGKGPNYARRVAIEASSGDILVFTDGDCIVPKHWIKSIVKNFEAPFIGCVGGSVFADEKLKGNLFVDYADASIMRIMPFAAKREILDQPKVFKHLAFCNMAIRREAINKIGGLDVKMKTFEDVDTVQSICEVGYKMVFDPEVYVWHKHRQTLRGILKQTYSYGKGGPMFRRKHPKSKIAKFYRMGLMAYHTFSIIISLIFALALIKGSNLLLLIGLLPFIMGYAAAIVYYVHKGNSLLRSLLYPAIDFMRIIAFCLGDLVGTIDMIIEERTDSKVFH